MIWRIWVAVLVIIGLAVNANSQEAVHVLKISSHGASSQSQTEVLEAKSADDLGKGADKQGVFVDPPIRYKEDAMGADGSLGKVLVLIVVLVVAGGGILFALKKRLFVQGLLPTGMGKHIQILDRRSVHRDVVIYYFAVDGKRYVLAVGNGHSNLKEIA